ncbi:transposase [Pseudomonas brenneri]|uniref:Transposase n=2 Tax=Pseudomonas brenneri TaxID=129817 RepID=A0A5B2UHJ3_9PSED|nr:transposase [Pseudomonas brenneri]
MSKYSDQFKLTAVQAYLEDGKGFRTVAQRFAVDFSLLRRWVCAFQKHGQFSLRKPGQASGTVRPTSAQSLSTCTSISFPRARPPPISASVSPRR